GVARLAQRLQGHHRLRRLDGEAAVAEPQRGGAEGVEGAEVPATPLLADPLEPRGLLAGEQGARGELAGAGRLAGGDVGPAGGERILGRADGAGEEVEVDDGAGGEGGQGAAEGRAQRLGRGGAGPGEERAGRAGLGARPR